jgi:hypothetical protein
MLKLGSPLDWGSPAGFAGELRQKYRRGGLNEPLTKHKDFLVTENPAGTVQNTLAEGLRYNE